MILRIIEVTSVSCVFIFISLGYCKGDLSIENANYSDEDDKLNQALVLVELLKTEYLRVIRENADLKEDVLSTTTGVLSTCATTAATGGNTSSTSEIVNASYTGTGLSQVPFALQPLLLPPTPTVIPRYAQGYYRRKMPSDYFYNGKESDLQNQAKDPVMAQITAELISELTNEGIALKSKGPALMVKKLKGSKKKHRDTKHSHNDNSAMNRLMTTAPKRTLRVHLAHSTRYPIPLPENHAFCFFSPNNALCRSPI